MATHDSSDNLRQTELFGETRAAGRPHATPPAVASTAPKGIVEQADEIARLYRDGLSAPKLADRFGCSSRSIYHALASVGVTPRTRGEANQINRKPHPLTDEILSLYSSGLSGGEVAVRCGVSAVTVYRTISRSGLAARPRVGCRRGAAQHPATFGQADVIANLYRSGSCVREIAEEYGCSISPIYRVLGDAGVQIRSLSDAKRVYELDESVFDRAEDDPEASYHVGLLMADGCVTRHNNSLTVQIGLKREDRGQIEQFARFLKTNIPIRDELKDADDWHPKPFEQSSIHVCSRRLGEALARYGVMPAKSHTAEVRLLEKNHPHTEASHPTRS